MGIILKNMLNKLIMQSMQRNASAILAARTCTPMPSCNNSRTFTRAFRKVVLRQDVEHLGFRGEVCFVKPGRALNDLVPRGDAYFFTDRRATEFMDTVVVSAIFLLIVMKRLNSIGRRATPETRRAPA